MEVKTVRTKTIFCLSACAALAAPLSAAGQLHAPGLHSPNLSPGRAGAARKQAPQKDPYTYGAAPAAPPEERSTSGLINPFFTRPAPAPVPGGRPGELTLPILTGSANGLRALTPQNVMMPPPQEADAGAQPAPQAPVAGAMAPPVFLIPTYQQSNFIDRGLRSIITPTILAFTEDIEPAYYGKEPDEDAPANPSYSVLGRESLALQSLKTDPGRIPSLGLHELVPGTAEETETPAYFRLASNIMTTRIISWRAAANMPQAPVDQGSGFQLPRVLQNLVNTNINFGLGIPNFSPNIGALTQGYLGLSNVFNYLPPDVADRFNAPYYTQPRQP
jgi:hypothetical protein